MATDIVDRDLIKARNKRWDLAFASKNDNETPHSITKSDHHEKSNRTIMAFASKNDNETPHSITKSRHHEKSNRTISYRKATVVIEHLIQLSDVSHTMQHWHMYRRWNERLFEESYVAYVEGRAEKNPSENWYQGELGFYDFYIIPLAKKIKQCAVFGVSSDEYLSYAVANREEWEERGEEVLKDMVKKMEAIYRPGTSRQTKDSEIRGDASATSGSVKSKTSIRDSFKKGSNHQLKDFDLGVEANAASPTSESAKSKVSSSDDPKKGSSCQPKDSEMEVEASAAIPTSESAHSESSSSDDPQKGSSCQPNGLETEKEDSVKDIVKNIEEICHARDESCKSADSDESCKSAFSGTFGGDDGSIRQPMDLEMGF